LTDLIFINYSSLIVIKLTRKIGQEGNVINMYFIWQIDVFIY